MGEEKSLSGGHNDYTIPIWSTRKLENELYNVLENRKKNFPIRFKQLKVFLKFFIKDPNYILSQEVLHDCWEIRGLPKNIGDYQFHRLWVIKTVVH